MLSDSKYSYDYNLKGDKQDFIHKPKKSDMRRLQYRMWLPYGKWTCSDGREILFNRYYEPVWERVSNCVNQMAVRANPHERVENIVKTTYVYDDSNVPSENKKSLSNCFNVIDDFNGAVYGVDPFYM